MAKKTHEFGGVTYQLLEARGGCLHLALGEKDFWLDPATKKRVRPVGRGFKPARGSVPGQKRPEAETKRAKPKAQPLRFREAVRIVVGASSLEVIVTKKFRESKRSGDATIEAFLLLGKSLGMSEEYMQGLVDGGYGANTPAQPPKSPPATKPVENSPETEPTA